MLAVGRDERRVHRPATFRARPLVGEKFSAGVYTQVTAVHPHRHQPVVPGRVRLHVLEHEDALRVLPEVRLAQPVQRHHRMQRTACGRQPDEVGARARAWCKILAVGEQVIDPRLPRHAQRRDALAVRRDGRPAVEGRLAREAFALALQVRSPQMATF